MIFNQLLQNNPGFNELFIPVNLKIFLFQLFQLISKKEPVITMIFSIANIKQIKTL